MRHLKLLLLVQRFLTMSAVVAACAATGNHQEPRQLPAPAATSPDGMVFGAPSSLLPAADGPQYSALSGSHFQPDPPFTHNLVYPTFNFACFEPAGGAGWADLAYAMYTLNTTGLGGAQPLRLTWEGEFPAPNDCWIGLGNLERNAWDWFALDGAVLPIADLAPYTDERELLLVAIVLSGTGEATLDWLTLGPGHPGYYEVEDNDAAAQANTLPPAPFLPSDVRGSLGTGLIYGAYDGDLADWFSFSLPAPGFAVLTIAPERYGNTSALQATIWRDVPRSGLTPIAAAAGLEQFTLNTYLNQAGEYFLELAPETPDDLPYAGDYELGLEFGAASFYETEPNDTALTADALPALPVPFGAVYGSVGETAAPLADEGEVVYDGSGEDWYGFDLAEAGPVSVEATALFGQLTLELYDASGTVLLGQAAEDNQPLRLVAVLADPGSYRLRVQIKSGSAHANYFLVLASLGQIGWRNSVACSENEVGRYLSLAVVEGRPAIACYDETAGRLLYTRAEDEWGFTWGVPVVVDDVDYAGLNCSLAIVNGKPAIAYFSFDDSYQAQVQYTQALDATGAAWGAPMVLAAGFSSGAADGLSLAVVNNRPAVCFCHELSGQLSFVQALDSDGSAWPEPVLLTGGVRGTFMELLPTPTNPAVAYVSLNDYRLHYLRASDADGATWSTEPVEVYSTQHVGFISAALVDGNPAIAFTTNTGGGSSEDDFFLRYVRATDTAGAAWGPVVDLELSGGCWDPSLAVIDGRPAISFNNLREKHLCYMESLDAAGTTWSTPELADHGPYLLRESDMCELNGRPAVAYWYWIQIVDGDVKFAIKL